MRIVGFESIFYLSTFAIDKQWSRHSICSFGGSVSPDSEKELLGRAGQDVQVFWEQSGKEHCIFSGRIKEVRVFRALHSLSVEVEARSHSVIEDEAEHTRLWQNPKKKIGDVLASYRLPLSACTLQVADKLQKLAYPAPILQNKETDFSFLLRIQPFFCQRRAQP